MTIIREINGKLVQIELTEVELYAAYFEKDHQFNLEDAKNQVINMLESEDEDKQFKTLARYDWHEALEIGNPHYALEALALVYEHRFDCSRSNNDQWSGVILNWIHRQYKEEC